MLKLFHIEEEFFHSVSAINPDYNSDSVAILCSEKNMGDLSLEQVIEAKNLLSTYKYVFYIQ